MSRRKKACPPTSSIVCEGGRMSRVRERDVSTRLIRPTLDEINLKEVVSMVRGFDPQLGGKITVFDEGIAQYALTDSFSHSKFYAVLVIGRPATLHCTVIDNEPNDVLESKNNTFTIIGVDTTRDDPETMQILNLLKEILGKRGYRFND